MTVPPSGAMRTPISLNTAQRDANARRGSLAAWSIGLARIQNFVVFVPGTKIGDQVKIRITKVHRRMAFGEVIRE